MMQQTAVKLIAWHADGSMRSFELESSQGVFVGKSTNCGLQLNGHDISDIHCRIGFEGGQLWVQDWMSAKGTRLNGDPVTSKTQVGQGAVVEVGPYKIQISKMEAGMEPGDPGEAPPEFSAQKSDEQNTDTQEAGAGAASDWDENIPGPCEVTGEPSLRDRQDEQDQPSDWQGEGRPGSSAESEFDFFSNDEEEELYDRQTVELLQAEIDDLRTALAQRDADLANVSEAPAQTSTVAEDSEKVLQRMEELVEEANRADERVLILEEMLHAAEDANRSEVEERAQLEAWVGDIEKRIGQREQEHAAELDALRERIDGADQQTRRLQRQLQQTATTDDSAHKQYEETLENLQRDNSQLQDLLAEANKELRQLRQKCENQAEENDVALREERAKIAKEHAEMSRLKFEYAQKIQELEETPQLEADSRSEADPRIQRLQEHRQYLREMSQQKKVDYYEQPSLSSRLKRLWKRIE